jgi:hypothetical protein
MTVTTSRPRACHTRAAAASAPSKAVNFIEPERRQAMISEAAYSDRALGSDQAENRYGG